MRNLTRLLSAKLITIVFLVSAIGVGVAVAESGSSGSGSNSGSNSGSGKGGSDRETTTTTPDTQTPTDNSGPGNSESTQPVTGEKVRGERNDGKVKVKLPGSDKAVDLENAGEVPSGSVVDARHGAVRLTAPGRQWAVVRGSVFQVTRGTRGPRPVTELVLQGGDFSACGSSRPAAFVAGRGSGARKPVRGLWARGKGNFRTRGRNGAATVRGTSWYTADTCDGTLVKVKRGKVAVRDFARKLTVLVRRGEKYLARPAAGSRRNSSSS